ncbi:hypothetical protein [Candidatus Enterococcus ikei]|uniref:Uncharacterized protein n=1 Tax=Candidatus Enterococcus ikei TaxID=2815326 RepID=A0ABS3GUU7_9ENTE|nr:hypothetical protein [Enterococcus sp. DIV0869a]MBO0439033.1 hypothetical protein [Enterococcus sp. DIV0869a]
MNYRPSGKETITTIKRSRSKLSDEIEKFPYSSAKVLVYLKYLPLAKPTL